MSTQPSPEPAPSADNGAPVAAPQPAEVDYAAIVAEAQGMTDEQEGETGEAAQTDPPADAPSPQDAAASPDAPPTTDPDAAPTPPAEPDPAASKADYWAKVVEADRQNRELKAQLKDSESLRAQYQQAEKLASEDPLLLLEHLGTKREDIFNRLLAEYAEGGTPAAKPADPGADPTAGLDRQGLEKLIAESVAKAIQPVAQQVTEARKGDVESRQTATIAQLTNEAGAELVAAEGPAGYKLVFDVAAELVAQNNVRLTGELDPQLPALYKQAIELVEGHYLEAERARVEKRRGLGKLAELYGGAAPQAPAPITTQPAAAPVPTLGAAAPQVAPPNHEAWGIEDTVKEAIRMTQQELDRQK